uniref:Thymus, brain and testes associated n=1 Tax=Anolis carolinensis TaxID=28377 RepID=A0A803TPM2_ANOCA
MAILVFSMSKCRGKKIHGCCQEKGLPSNFDTGFSCVQKWDYFADFHQTAVKGENTSLPHGCSNPLNGSLSDAWREELRELATRVTATSFTKKEKKETFKAADRALCCRSLGCCEFSGLYGHVSEAFFPDVSPTSMAGILRGCETEKSRRETQYSEETGRLIPPPSRAITRHSSHRTHKNNVKNKGKDATMTFQDQELIILEMLCQILQTDSLTSIQQWLLTAGQRDKDLVMGLLQIATANLQTQEWTTNMEENCPQLSPNTSSCSSSLCNLGKNHLRRVCVKTQKPEPIPEEEKPVHVGTAEVLQFHSNLNEKQKQPATK